MIRKDIISGAYNGSGAGEKDGIRRKIEFQEGERVYFVENNRTVRPASIIRKMGDFYTISIGTGGITLRGSRLYASEEEALNSIPGNNRSAYTGGYTSEAMNRRGYRSPYSCANERSPYGI